MAPPNITYGDLARTQFQRNNRYTFPQWQQEIGNLSTKMVPLNVPGGEPNPDHPSWTKLDNTMIEDSLAEFRTVARLDPTMFTNATGQMQALEGFILECTGPIKYTMPMKVAVQGLPNAGKSTLVNAITFPQQKIAPAERSSQIVTRWPMVIRYSDIKVNKNLMLVLQLHLHSPQAIHDECTQFVEHIIAYFEYKDLPQVLSDILYSHECHFEAAKNFAHRAFNAFNYRSSSTDLDVDSIVQKITSLEDLTDKYEGYLATVSSWMAGAVEQIKNDQRTVLVEDHNSRMLEFGFENYSSYQNKLKEFRTGPLDVLIRHAEVFTKDSFFATGLQIIDIPGTGEKDEMRNRIGREFSDLSNFSVICTGTERSRDAPKIDELVKRSMARVGGRNTLLVKTRIDEQCGEAALRSFLQETDWEVAVQDRDALLKADEAIERVSEIDDSTLTEIPDIDALDDYRSHIIDVGRANMVWAGCEDDATLLQQFYDPRTDETVQLRFAAAEVYINRCTVKKSLKKQPFLDAEQTGIPALKREILGFTGDVRLQSVQDHTLGPITTCCDYVERICYNKNSVDDSRALSKVKEDVFTAYFSALQNGMPGSIETTLQIEVSRSVSSLATDATIQELDNLVKTFVYQANGEKMHRQTFDKIGRDGGYYKRKLKSKDTIMEWNWPNKLCHTFEPAVNNLRRILVQHISACADAMRSDLRKMQQDISTRFDGLGVNLENLQQSKNKWINVSTSMIMSITAFETSAKARLHRCFQILLQKTDAENLNATALSKAMRQELQGFDAEFWHEVLTTNRKGQRYWKRTPKHPSDGGEIFEAQRQYVQDHIASRRFIKTMFAVYAKAASRALREPWAELEQGILDKAAGWQEHIDTRQPIAEERTEPNELIREELIHLRPNTDHDPKSAVMREFIENPDIREFLDANPGICEFLDSQLKKMKGKAAAGDQRYVKVSEFAATFEQGDLECDFSCDTFLTLSSYVAADWNKAMLRKHGVFDKDYLKHCMIRSRDGLGSTGQDTDEGAMDLDATLQTQQDALGPVPAPAFGIGQLFHRAPRG